jgi:hypothetical protein
MRRATARWLWPALLVLIAVVWPAAAATTRLCSDPCFQAAKGEFHDCVSSAQGAFLTAVDGCLEHDHTCVDACRSQRQDCLDGTGIGPGYAGCATNLAAAKARCRLRLPAGSRRLALCIDRAEADAFRCRSDVRRNFLHAVQSCNKQFGQCAGACGPGGPPGGPDSCKAEGKAALTAALASCKQTFQVTAIACFNKDVTCVQSCADDRAACTAPTSAMLDAALAACRMQEAEALASCQMANPGGGAALQQCITNAQADAFACREAALNASTPGFEACLPAYIGCVRSCPPA